MGVARPDDLDLDNVGLQLRTGQIPVE